MRIYGYECRSMGLSTHLWVRIYGAEVVLTFGDLGDVAFLHGSGRAVNFGIQSPFGPIEADGEGGGLVHLQPRLLWGDIP